MESSSPTPTQCDRTRLICNSRNLVDLDVHVASACPQPGDGISDFIFFDESINHSAGANYRLAGIGIEAVPGDAPPQLRELLPTSGISV